MNWKLVIYTHLGTSEYGPSWSLYNAIGDHFQRHYGVMVYGLEHAETYIQKVGGYFYVEVNGIRIPSVQRGVQAT